MGKVLEGLVVNPKKRKTKAKRNPTKVLEVRKPTRKGGSKKVGLLIVKNPSRDRNALLMLASGTALGLAGGKLIDRYVVSSVSSLRNLSATLPVGDSLMLLGGLTLLKNSSQKNREFALGIVAGAGAKLVLNLIDRFIFKGQGTVGLYGEELSENPYDDEAIPAEYEEYEEEPYALPEPAEEEYVEGEETGEDYYEEPDYLGEEEEEPVYDVL
ncbi:MAG: hypothetical protein GXN96_01405 [Aquificae bacterium]|nr:hypothetical protein [Aquificota bacterium]